MKAYSSFGRRFWVYLGVKTCQVFLCSLAIIFVVSNVLTSQWLLCIHCFTSLVSFTGFYTEDGPRFCHRGHPGILAHALTYLCRGKAEGEGNNIGDFISGNGTSIWQKCNIARAVSNDQLGIIRAWLKRKI